MKKYKISSVIFLRKISKQINDEKKHVIVVGAETFLFL